MSYEKVRSICIKENDVFITSATNNCRPLSYTRDLYPYFSKILKEQGREAVEIALLRSYEEGSLQGGSNKYTKALKVLRYVYGDEYAKFNWRNHWNDGGKGEELRKSEEFTKLLKKCLKYKFPNEKWVIYKPYGLNKIYGKSNPTCMSWRYDKENATKFDFEEEAKDHIFNAYKDVWGVEKAE